MKKFITGFFALLVGITANSQNLRSNFLNGKSQAEIVESFNNLSTREKNDLWLEKIDQVLSQNIPHENLIILEQMKNFHVNKNLENFKAKTLEMARITPAEDFKAMFTNLFDYKFNGRFIGNLEQTYVFNSDFDTFGKSIEIIENRVKKCNCRWTCDWYAGGNQGNCTITDSGCGFMWAFECTGYVGP